MSVAFRVQLKVYCLTCQCIMDPLKPLLKRMCGCPAYMKSDPVVVHQGVIYRNVMVDEDGYFVSGEAIE